MLVQIKTQRESKMVANLKGNIIADFACVVEAPTRNHFYKKARYSNGGVIVSKVDRSNKQSKMKIITMSNDVLKDMVATPSTVHRQGTVLDYETSPVDMLESKQNPHILRQTSSLESLINSVGSSSKEADRSAIHHELFRTPLQFTSLIGPDK